MKLQDLLEYKIKKIPVKTPAGNYNEPIDEAVEEFKQALLKIKNECIEIFKIYKQTNKYLYRGVRLPAGLKNKQPMLFNGAIRNNRKRMDTSISEEDTISINEALRQLGIEARRNNSLFTSPHISVAEAYGIPYMIFPKDGFKYSWFQNQKKTYVFTQLQKITEDWEYEEYHMKQKNIDDKKIKNLKNKYFLDGIKKLQPTDKNLTQALLKNKEVLITGENGYYAVLCEPDYMQYFSKVIKNI